MSARILTSFKLSDFLKSLKVIGIKPSEIKQPRQFELAIKATSDWYEKLEKLSKGKK